jgi:SAM-dependent methyltransferase
MTALASRTIPTQIDYVPYLDLWERFPHAVRELIDATGARDIGELGGGANPTTSLIDEVDHPIELTVLDISAEELAKAPDGVRKLQVDLCSPYPPARSAFDLVFSRMLCEHVPSAERFHRNCALALRPGGHAVHFFPTVSALPFAVNRVVPEALGDKVLSAFFPSRQAGGQHQKFPAYYHWCHGPTPNQLARYRSVGLDVVRYEVGVGHGYYDRIPGLRSLESRKADLALSHPSPLLASYALVVLRRSD